MVDLSAIRPYDEGERRSQGDVDPPFWGLPWPARPS